MRKTFVDEDDAHAARELIDAIEDSYYKTVDEDEARGGVLKGIVESLDDRFSHYFTPKEAKVLRAVDQRPVRGRRA